ncbi:hypothetical protein EG829_33570, partial [bacterium]|nr:hypothetical protein [bacterium]
MMPDFTVLAGRMQLKIPLLGLYDSPGTSGFEPTIVPEQGKHVCLFSYFDRITRGETLVITRDNFGCGGAGSCLCGVQTRSRDDYVKFLYEGEGLKASKSIMEHWFDRRKSYDMRHPYILLGPLRAEKYEYLRTVTFFVNPDQLSILIIGANHRSVPGDPPAVLAPFGSGCMELL